MAVIDWRTSRFPCDVTRTFWRMGKRPGGIRSTGCARLIPLQANFNGGRAMPSYYSKLLLGRSGWRGGWGGGGERGGLLRGRLFEHPRAREVEYAIDSDSGMDLSATRKKNLHLFLNDRLCLKLGLLLDEFELGVCSLEGFFLKRGEDADGVSMEFVD